jgi:mono/diheme cytochrome c family protein
LSGAQRAGATFLCGFLLILPLNAEDFSAYPNGPGKAVFLRVCTRCHEAANGTKLRLTRRQWQGKVYAQADRGAEASGEELDQIVDYLSRNFGPGRPQPPDQAAGAKK